MKLNGINVDEQFLLSELAEWEGKLSVLAQRIAEKYNMSDKFTSVENVRKVLSKMKKNLFVKEDNTHPMTLDFQFKPNVQVKLYFQNGGTISMPLEDAFEYPPKSVCLVHVECPMKKSDIDKLKNHFKYCNVNYPFDYISEEEMFPPFEGEKKGFNYQPLEEIVKKYNNNFPDFEEQVKRVSKPLPLINMVFGDKHHPFSHYQYLDFWLENRYQYLKRADYDFGKGNYNVRYISIGDIIDGQAIKFHPIDPNLSSASDELMEAKIHLAEWYKEFPDVWVMEGNHDALYDRKVLASGLPKECIKPLNELLEVPNWKFVDEFVDTQYGILFTHGTNLSKTSIKTKALKENLSVVCGHHHSLMSIEYVTQNKFVAFTGCGIDFSSRAFNYARGGVNTPLLGGLVIYDGQPILEVMKEV